MLATTAGRERIPKEMVSATRRKPALSHVNVLYSVSPLASFSKGFTIKPSLLLSKVMVSSPSGIVSFSSGSLGGGACSRSVFDAELTLPAV